MKKFFSSIWLFLKSAPSAVWRFSKKHKIITVIIVLVILGAGYFAYTAIAAASSGTEYVLGSVTRGPLVVTVTGSGQVDANNTLNVTPQGSASGQILRLNVTPGQAVTAGEVIAQLDSTTADEAVTSAKQNLESAQISYQQTLTSSGSSVTSDQSTVSTDQTNNLNALQSNYTDLPTVMTGLDGILHDISTISEFTAQENLTAYSNFIPTAQSQAYAQQVQADYVAANSAYQNAKAEYVNDDTSTITEAQIEQLDTDTITANQSIETAVKDTLAYFNYLNAQIQAAKITRATQLSSQTASLTSYQSTLTTDSSSITSAQTALVNAQNTLTADTESLNGTQSQPLTVQTAELNVEKAQESLSEAETTASYYTVTAPFSGVIGSVPVNQYDQASSGTTIATLITTDDYVDLSLNEADAAKVQVGQSVSLTFDALPNVTVAGNVATIDPVGTVSSGIDTYDVRISLAQQNSEIKPGMTAEAVITTASSTNAIQVPSAAIKTSGNSSYVEVATLLNASSTMAKYGAAGASSTGTHRTRTASSTSAYGGFGGGAFASSSMSTTSGMSLTTAMTSRSLTVPASEVKIKNVTITTGLSNDTMTQILSGLTPGEFIVTATESATANTTKTAAASATSLLGGTTGRTGLGGAGGGYTGGGGTRTGGATGGAAAR
jgi:RND family efflux transporter MFP subunit